MENNMTGPLGSGGTQPLSSVASNSTTQSEDLNSRPQSFSQVTRSSNNNPSFPKKDQAILINFIEDLKLSEYVISIGNIVGPKNILFASRISNNRICIYLSDIKYVDEVINHDKIEIRGNEVHIRRLISPAKRIIISNVCPSIPHYILEQVFSDMGFKLVSPVSFLRANIQDNQYSHVLSFRRQVFIHPDNRVTLPSTTIINHDDTNYRIFFSYDELICFTCKLPGHIASSCPNQPNTMQITPPNATQITPKDNIAEEQSTNSDIANENFITLETTNELLMDPTTTVNRATKRAASSTISTPLENIMADDNNPFPDTEKDLFLTPTNKNPTEKKQTKKLKKSDSSENLFSLSEMLSPLKQIIEEANPPYVLTYDQLYDFFENVHGNSDPLGISLTYTEDTQSLLYMIGKLYRKLSHRNIKSRFTRIRNKIREQLRSPEDTGHYSDSDMSQISI